MRLRPLIVLGTVAALLFVSGCAPEPEAAPTPTPTRAASPTPTEEPIVAPETAFDVTCDDVATTMRALVGEPTTPVVPALSTVSTMSWIPGPAQYMFQRAGGIACSAGDTDRRWEVTIVPGAEVVIAGATERHGFWGEVASCENGFCQYELPVGDVLLSAFVVGPETDGDGAAIEEAMRRLASQAADTARDVPYIDSDLVGASCDRYITTEQVSALVGEESVLFTDYGGWGIPSEVYTVVNGSSHCFYTSAEGDLGSISSHLLVTALPAGAWAFETIDGEVVEVDGADAAKVSGGPHGETYLDVRVGAEWIRVATFDEGSGAPDSVPFAEEVIRTLAVGAPVPE